MKIRLHKSVEICYVYSKHDPAGILTTCRYGVGDELVVFSCEEKPQGILVRVTERRWFWLGKGEIEILDEPERG